MSVASLQAAAVRMIDKHGRALTLNRYSKAINDATSTTTLTPTAYSVTGLETDFKSAAIPETLVKAKDVIFLVAGRDLAIEPQQSDQLVDGAVKLRVKHVTRVKPGGSVFLYGILAEA